MATQGRSVARESEEDGGSAADSGAAEAHPVAAGLAERLFQQVWTEGASGAAAPLSTYRVQLHAGFRFEDARRVVPYLSRLGATDLYASPYLKAAPGSTHGYDCVDHRSVNPEIGSEVEHASFCAVLREHGLGQVLDFVPNHMGITGGNALWIDVLENGPASIAAPFFDVDWHPVKEELQEKVLLPILGDPYGEVLERGELSLRFSDGAFFVDYFGWALPISVRQYGAILRHGLEAPRWAALAAEPDVTELHSILTAIAHLPRRTEAEAAKRAERNREKEVVKRRLGELVRSSERIRSHVLSNVVHFRGRVGEPRSFDALDALLNAGSFRLAHWRVAGEEINYRRFFDINTLAAIRVEDPEVFQEAHALVFRWLEEGKVTGLRIDHPDGLFDPTQYFLRLQEEFFVRRARARAKEPSPEAWAPLERELRARFRDAWAERPDAPEVKPLYVVVEKIQGGRERIPDSWAVHGTTGYRFANTLTGLLVDPSAERMLTRTYERFIGRRVSVPALVYEKKKLVLEALMASELNVLARELNRISEMNRHTRDFTLASLKRALAEFIALFPVYRTYVDDWRAEVDGRDIRYVQWTIRRAKEKDATTNASVYDFLERILLRRYARNVPAEQRAVMLRFAMKVQQLSGPVMAKGLEDTAFYVYNRFVALNEVGGEPERFGSSPAAFHLRNQERAERWPFAMLATSTHDTKRSEDVRARLCVLSELPELWTGNVRRWARLNRRYKARPGGGFAPSANDEYLYYQTLVGAWPMGERLSEPELAAFQRRLQDYLLKAAREAKVHTSWLNQDSAYEEGLTRFVELTLAGGRSRFFDEAAAFKRQIERAGQVGSLAMVLFKLASPGTTDVYQGCELWDLSLVDPDNRRPVDFDQRARMLDELDRALDADRAGAVRRLFGDMTDGAAKLFVLSQGLRLRRRQRALFQSGSYLPLDVVGPAGDRAVAFARRHESQVVLAAGPRLVARMLDGFPQGFAGTEVRLPDELEGVRWVDVFTGRAHAPERRGGVLSLPLVDLWQACPVALLEGRT